MLDEFANACPNQTELIMLTLSRRNGFETRKAIRQTWMNDSVPGEVISFLIADAGDGEAIDVQKKLEEEQAKHGDLVFLHGFIDIYAHLHLKVVLLYGTGSLRKTGTSTEMVNFSILVLKLCSGCA
uniref:Hexosyltransferase n=1 Tax=Globodera rostochiensis TaxID=31243 RepID=A0A914I0L8_GLORO